MENGKTDAAIKKTKTGFESILNRFQNLLESIDDHSSTIKDVLCNIKPFPEIDSKNRESKPDQTPGLIGELHDKLDYLTKLSNKLGEIKEHLNTII